MKPLYLLSSAQRSGKTALGIGLVLELRDQGLRAGYFKPVGTQPVEMDGRIVDADAQVAVSLLEPGEDPTAVAPVLLTAACRELALQDGAAEARPVVEAHRERAAQRYPALVVEGPAGLTAGRSLGLGPLDLVRDWDAGAVLVMPLSDAVLAPADDLLFVQDLLGERLLGLVLNQLDLEWLEQHRAHLEAFVARHNLKLFGLLPKDPLLSAITVGELASQLHARFLCREDQAGTLVQRFSVGAMGAEAAFRAFLQASHKAVITGGDRADVQMAALATPTACLILTGGLEPDPGVLRRADELGVPVLLVQTNTLDTIRAIEQLLGGMRLHDPQQVARLRELLRAHLDSQALCKALGWT